MAPRSAAARATACPGKRHTPPRKAKEGNKASQIRRARAVSRRGVAVNQFCYILELGSAFVWEYLAAEDISSVLRVCSARVSSIFSNSRALKGLDQLAVENKMHLGRRCGCDWMRGLDFLPYSNDGCSIDDPFSVDKSIPILHTPSGAQDLLNALVLTTKLMQPFCTGNGRSPLFVPVVCPLATSNTPHLRTKAAIARAMNDIFPGAGTHYFYKSKVKGSSSSLDFLHEHWDGIHSSSCLYCVSLVKDASQSKHFVRWDSYEAKRIRENCKALYRPLKAAMLKNLQHVRFVPPLRCSRKARNSFKGLVAGIATGGILCGLYVATGYWPYQ